MQQVALGGGGGHVEGVAGVDMITRGAMLLKVNSTGQPFKVRARALRVRGYASSA
jgi:hypothetical protein